MRTRLRCVWGGIALLGAAVALLDGGALTLVARGEFRHVAVCPTRRIADPYEAAARFLASGVQRRDLAAAYTLATASLRGARSCSEWARGRVPFAEFRDIDWSRSSYQTVAGGEGQVVLRVLLYRRGVELPVPYLMELQTGPDEPGWHVGYFGRDRWFRLPEPPSPAA
jgi:hypothetical protein